MKLDYRKQGKVKTNMTDYLKKIMDDLPDKYQGRAITPAANHFFEFNETARKLSKKYTHTFHTIVEKFLFLCKREWPDILTGVALLTRVVRKVTPVRMSGHSRLHRKRNFSTMVWNICVYFLLNFCAVSLNSKRWFVAGVMALT